MHDPLVVAFEIRRPWPQRSRMHDAKPGRARWRFRLHHDCVPDCDRDHGANPFPWWRPRSWTPFWTLAGRGYYWPSMITVWHREPGGRDSGDVCRHYVRVPQPDGTYRTRVLHGWQWHVHHWRIQVGPLQSLRRTLLTRCSWCGGRHRKGDPVNVSHQWDAPRERWWRGEPGLYHHGCSMIQNAHRVCLCDHAASTGRQYGACPDCGKLMSVTDPHYYAVRRVLARVPAGERGLAELAEVERMRKEQEGEQS